MTDAPYDYCPECGSVLEHVRLALEVKDRALADLELELRGKRAQISRLKGERQRAQALSPYVEPANACFRYWQQHISPAAREFNGERFEHVVARIRAADSVEHGVARVKRAIDGAKARPRAGRTTDLLTICRNETNLLMFMDFATAAGVPQDAHLHGADFDSDGLAALVAERQLAQLDAQALVGNLSASNGDGRRILATALRLAARDVLEAL